MSSSFSAKNGRNAAIWAAGQLQDAEKQGLGYLDAGMDKARTNYGAATDLYDPLRQTFTRGADAYANATGVNGAAGYAQAAANFQHSPGYTQSVDAGLNSVSRRLASLGQLGSGNAQMALNDYAQNRENDQWNTYLQSLAPFNAAALQSTAGQAGTMTGLGNLEAAGGMQSADLLMNNRNQIAQIGMQGFKAGDQAAANRMSALQGGIGLGSKLLGGAFGGFGR